MSTPVIFAFISAFFSGGLALAVAWNERRSIANWAFVVGMLILATEGVLLGLSEGATLAEAAFRWQKWRIVAVSFLPGTWLFFSLSYARGNYRDFLTKWRLPLIAAFLVPPGLAVFFHEELLTPVTDLQGSTWMMFSLGTPGIILNVLVLLSAVLIVMNLERTYRAAVGTMRWRIKLMVLGLGVLFVVRAYTCSQILLFHSVDISLQTVNSGALLVASLLVLRSLFREGHFDMNVYPSHSVLHNSFTILLAGVYLVIVAVFAKVIAFMGGDVAFTLKAFILLVALVLLTVLLLSDRVRVWMSRFVSRHFQRPLYDYRTVWRRFTEGTASCVQQVELCQAATKLVADIFQVLSVTIWLVDDKREQMILGASTLLSEAKWNELKPQGRDMIELIQALRNHSAPVDIDSSKEMWAATLRRCHPDEFRKGGNRICVPMIVGGEILGFMVLGDRVGGLAFAWQDFDLLKCVGDEVGAGLLNAQLSQRLLQAKELEAFQAMSAFFVHDLKNTASTLNLMLQNLPVHFDDPAFREDALRGISKTVTHINQLIGRLNLLRHDLQIQPVESDFNEVVLKSLESWGEAAGVDLVKNLVALPKALLDQEQMHKVVINLVLNAREAVSAGGEVRIETGQRNGCIMLTVADNGCGMNPTFLNRSLFRPFQTTKKNGLGIGMFQSRMIVEAHGGRIEVESELGKGSTFRVFLPLQKQNK